MKGTTYIRFARGLRQPNSVRANGRNIVGQQLPTLLNVTRCVRWHTLLKLVKLLIQQLPTFLMFRDLRNVAQQFWIRLHSSSNITGPTQADYTWSLNSYGLYPSHDALQVPTLVGVVAFVCTPLVPTQTHHKLPTLSDYQSCQVW